MICMLTHRRLKPGTYDQFRAAWEMDRDAIPDEMRGDRVYLARSLGDENEILTFHLTNQTREDLSRLRGQLAKGLTQRQQAVAEFVESTGVDGVFEVIEEIEV
jgi:hypothetical protein